MLNFLGNVIWLLFGGFLAAAGYFLGGLFFCLTIIGIPFGIQSFKLGVASLTPFGKDVVAQKQQSGPLHTMMDVIWAIFFGWEIALAHLTAALALAITIVGIPFALQLLKLVPVALLPFRFRLE